MTNFLDYLIKQEIIDHKELIQKIKDLGFRFVTLDLEGIKHGGYDVENKRNC